MFPRPRTAEPSETTATEFFFTLIRRASSWCSERYEAAVPTPGVYQSEKSSLERSAARPFISIRGPCFLYAESIFFASESIWSGEYTPCKIIRRSENEMPPGTRHRGLRDSVRDPLRRKTVARKAARTQRRLPCCRAPCRPCRKKSWSRRLSIRHV